jgi:uncharacterized spore protein YtfJ
MQMALRFALFMMMVGFGKGRGEGQMGRRRRGEEGGTDEREGWEVR